MKKTNNICFKANNVTKYSGNPKNINSKPLVSNLFFSINSFENTSFVFDNKEDKQAFINIFSGRDKNFSGFIKLDTKLFLSKNIHSIEKKVFCGDVEKFYKNKKHQNEKTLYFLKEKDLLNLFVQKQKESILSYNNYNHLNKFCLIFEAKQIELQFNKNINNEIEKMILDIQSFITLIIQAKENENLEQCISIIKNFYNKYNEYICSRSNLLCLKNNELINLILNDVTNKNNIKRNNLTKDIEKIKLEINPKKFLKKTKIKDPSNKNRGKAPKNSILLLKIQENDFYLSGKRCKSYAKNVKDNKVKIKYLSKYYVNYFCYIVLKKNMNRLAFLTEKQAMEFIHELKNQYSILLLNLNFALRNKKHFKVQKSILKKLKDMFTMNINSYINLSYENKQAKIAKVSSINKKDIQDNSFNWENNIELKKTQYQNLLDEYEWEHSHNIISINEKLLTLNEKAKVQIEKFNKQKKELDRVLSNFIKERDKFVLQAKENEKYLNVLEAWKLDQSIFKTLNQESVKIYNLLKKESQQINFFLKNKIQGNKRKHFHDLIFKYHIYEKAYLCGLTVHDLDKPLGQQTNLNISKLFLTKSLLSNKKILLFNNLLSSLEPEDRDVFSNIYNSVSSSFPNIWINTTNNYKDIENITTNINIIKNSKNIEFGSKSIIEDNPFYKYTNLLISNHNHDLYNERELNTNIQNDNYLNDFEYDFYEIDINHFVYANIEDIYKWTHKIPNAFEWTFVPLKIDEIKNKIKQEQNYKSTNKHKKKLNYETNEKVIINLVDTK